jgi:hypothetical protein
MHHIKGSSRRQHQVTDHLICVVIVGMMIVDTHHRQSQHQFTSAWSERLTLLPRGEGADLGFNSHRLLAVHKGRRGGYTNAGSHLLLLLLLLLRYGDYPRR